MAWNHTRNNLILVLIAVTSLISTTIPSVSALSVDLVVDEITREAGLLIENLGKTVESGWGNPRVDDAEVYRLEMIDNGSSQSQSQRRQLVEEVRHVATLLDLDIWYISSTHIDILIPTSNLLTLSSLLPPSIHIPATPFLTSTQLADLTRPKRPPTTPPSDEDGWNTSTINTSYHDTYHPLVNHSKFMDDLQRDFGDVVEKIVVGKSAEGRDIEGLKLHLEGGGGDVGMGKKSGKWMRWTERFASWKDEDEEDEEEGKEIFMMGGQHAREWVAPATILYLAHRLVLDSKHDETTRKLLHTFTFVLIPTINPDGYVYTHEYSRLWRKNRQDVGAGSCKGIDMNANWGYKWSSSPSLLADESNTAFSNPCSDSFPGISAFQAVETRAIADYLHARKGSIKAFIDMHSYGQLFMFPYSYSCSDFPGDAETLMEAGLGVARAIKLHSGTQYKTGQACDLVYRMAGDSVDFAYGEEGIKWAYSAELRDTGTYGFLLPPREIRPTAEEMTAGLLYLAEFIRTLELGPRG